MSKRSLIILIILISLAPISCNKKTHPSKDTGTWLDYNTHSVTEYKKSEVVKPPAVAKKTISKNNTSFPKVIIVSDKAAKKSVYGRYYYDINGHRYWRNKFDGKYYIFDKSMYTDKAFKPN